MVLGEYAVLEGAPAMVLAVDRYCRAEIGASEDERCHLSSRSGTDRAVSFAAGGATGFPVVDEVLRGLPGGRPWRGSLDSRALFAGEVKLGLGSSAAALTAWAGAWAEFSGRSPLAADSGTLGMLLGLHRAVQGGAGSGVDVAASLFGGVIRYELGSAGGPRVSAVRLPNGVGFAGIFTRSAASTPDYLARYDAWRARAPEEAAAHTGVLAEIAQGGMAAATADDVQGFLDAVVDYGGCLQQLGERIGADIVTRAHRGVLEQASRLGIAYKVSGAGGGDLGLAFSADTDALEAFKRSVARDWDVIELAIDSHGLRVETAAT